MMLGYYLDSEVVLVDIYIFVGADSFDKRVLDFKTGVVGMM